MPSLGLVWVELGTTFSFLGAILGLLNRLLLMPCLVLITFLRVGIPQMPSKTCCSIILIKFFQHPIKFSMLVLFVDLLLQIAIFLFLQAFKPPSLQAPKAPTFNPPRRVTRSANNFLQAETERMRGPKKRRSLRRPNPACSR